MRKLPAVLLAALVLLAQPAWAKVYIDITSPGLQKVPVAVPEFRLLGPAPAVGGELADVLSNDLDYTGFFKVVPRQAYLPPTPEGSTQPASLIEGVTSSTIDFRRWSLIGSQLLVTGGLKSEGPNLRLELRLFDVLDGKMLVGKAYVGTKAQTRQMVHRFAAEVVRFVTGQESIFDTKIAFVSDVRGNKELHVMDFDGCNAMPLTRMGALTMSPAWSPSGRELAFISYHSGKPDLYIVDRQARRVRFFYRSKGLSMSPAWSPDGRVVCAAISFAGNTELCLLSPEGKLVRRLTKNPAIDIEPSWSPDGKRLAFCSSRGGTPQIYVMEVDSGQVRRLTFSGSYNTSPTWSPRGDRIVFAGRVNGHFELFSITPEGGDARQITSGEGSKESPAFSPDGMLVAYSSTKGGGSRIWVMNADGGNQRPVGPVAGRQTEPAWSARLGRP